MTDSTRGRTRRPARARAGVLLAAALVALAACKTLPPVVGTALVGFGQDVLAVAAHNFAPQYSASMQELFFAMAEGATGMPFTQQAQNAPGPAEDPYAQADYPDGYGQPQYPGAQYPEEQYSEPAYPGGEYGYGQEQDGEGQYAQGSYYDGEYAQDPYAQDPHAQGQYAQGEYDPSAYATPGYVDPAGPLPQAHAAPPGVALDVALLAQQRTPEGEVRLRPVADGDVLYDGRGDPQRGDKIKIFFAANCACHVYVIGIDATGYVAQIFPEAQGNASSRVAPGARYLVPGGTTWWGLDEYRGIEQIYFIASRERRADIENLVTQLAGQRPAPPANYRSVRQPAIVPVARGLVQVQSAAPTVVPTEYGAGQQISPVSFQSTVADADLVITRWFRHE